MNALKIFFQEALLLLCVFHLTSCSATNTKSEIILIGSTPGDSLIKTMLAISVEENVDFIRWNLILGDKNAFVLDINYGESQPNTLGFKKGGQKKSYQGEFRISKNKDYEIYQLKSGGFQTEIEMTKLDANIFHLLTPQKQLMPGNGGWSYTLNNKTPDKNKYSLPTLTNSTTVLNDTSLQVIYDGRTPCQDFAVENNLTVNQSCFKLKWKLVLNRDPKTFKPTTYALKRTNSRENDITGNWVIIEGSESNPDAIIFQLDPDKSNQTISLFVGDENVLFFLHKDKNLFVGNDNFSFTLNRRPGVF